MVDATALQTQAFLRRTAIGADVDPETGALRATPRFTLGESLAGGGTTLIVTVADMLAFGRMHLAGGVAPNGTRVLSGEWVEAMQTPSIDVGLPQVPPVGLGWWLCPIAGTTAPWHAGGSPKGVSSFCILPEYDAVIVSFATGGQRVAIHDLVHNAVIEELTGRSVTLPFELSPTPPDADTVGEYAAFQARLVVDKDGDSLLVATHFEPYDDDHRDQLAGSVPSPTPVRFQSVAPGLFAPSGLDPASLAGLMGRGLLLATLPADGRRRAGLHTLMRYYPKSEARR